VVQLAALKIRKIKLLENVAARNGSEEIIRLIEILKGVRPIHV
jgi:hypothetical protein